MSRTATQRYVVRALEFRFDGKRYVSGDEIELPAATAKKFSWWLKPVAESDEPPPPPPPTNKKAPVKEPKQ